MKKKVVRTSEEKALLDFQSRPKVMFNQGENRFVGLNPEDDAKLAQYDRDRRANEAILSEIKKDERQKSEIAAAVTSDAIQKAFVEVMKRRLK